VLVIVLLIGAVFLGFLGTPSAGVADVGDWGTVTDERTEVVTSLWVDNPTPLGIKLGNGITVDYTLYMNDVGLAAGRKSNISIPSGNNTIEISTSIRNQRLREWWVSYVRANETIPVRINASADVDAGQLSTTVEFPQFDQTMLSTERPVIASMSGVAGAAEGNYTRSVSADELSSTAFGPLLGTVSPSESATVGYEVRRGWATWGNVTDDRTNLLLHFDVHNPSEMVPVPAEPENVGASIRMNDVALLNATGDDVALRNPGNFTTLESFGGPVIPPGETKHVLYAVEMDNDRIDDWFRSHVRREEVTDLRAQFQLVFEAGSQQFRVPQADPLAYECRLQTGILVDGQETTTNCDGAGGLVG